MSDVFQLAAKAIVSVVVAVGFALACKYMKPSARLSEAQLSALAFGMSISVSAPAAGQYVR